jgi:hypothetical protein
MQVKSITGAAIAVAIFALLVRCAPAPQPSPPTTTANEPFVEAPVNDRLFGFTEKRGQVLPSKGTVKVLVLFAGFRGSDHAVPDYAEELLTPAFPAASLIITRPCHSDN